MCNARRTASHSGTPAKVYPAVGAHGLMLLEYVGNEPDTWLGEVTNTAYPFDRTRVLYVDRADAVHFLGPDFIEVQ